MKGKIRKLILKTLVILMIGTTIQPALPAWAKVCLSRTKRTYDDYGSHFWDKIKLKNVPSNANIKWKSSDPSVIKIADRFKCGTWYRILKPGKATVTALYKGRKYTCKITVKKKAAHPSSTPKPTSKPVKDDDEDEDPPDPSLPKDARLNATHVTIYYCEPYAIPYAHDESHPTEFQFKLEGSDKRPVWDVTLDDPEVFRWLNISKDGLLTIPTGGCSDATATVTARYFNDVLTCKVTVINETRVKYDELVNEFIRTHIRDGMSDYEKMVIPVFRQPSRHSNSEDIKIRKNDCDGLRYSQYVNVSNIQKIERYRVERLIGHVKTPEIRDLITKSLIREVGDDNE